MEKHCPISLSSSAPVEDLRFVIAELHKNAFFKLFMQYVASLEEQAMKEMNSLDPSDVPAEKFVALYATRRGRYLARESLNKIVKGEI